MRAAAAAAAVIAGLLPAGAAAAAAKECSAACSFKHDPPASWTEGGARMPPKPFVDGALTFVGGVVAPWAGATIDVTSPIVDAATGERAVVGTLAQMGEQARPSRGSVSFGTVGTLREKKRAISLRRRMRTVYSLSFCRARSAVRRPRSGDNSRASLCLWQDAVAAVEAAAAAWDKGQGAWPRMSAAARIAAVEAVLADLQERRAEIVDVLMWEICKSAGDAVRSRVGYDIVCPPPTPAPGCWRQGERTADGQPRLGTVGAFHGCARPPVGGRQTGSRGVLLYDTPPPPRSPVVGNGVSN